MSTPSRCCCPWGPWCSPAVVGRPRPPPCSAWPRWSRSTRRCCCRRCSPARCAGWRARRGHSSPWWRSVTSRTWWRSGGRSSATCPATSRRRTTARVRGTCSSRHSACAARRRPSRCCSGCSWSSGSWPGSGRTPSWARRGCSARCCSSSPRSSRGTRWSSAVSPSPPAGGSGWRSASPVTRSTSTRSARVPMRCTWARGPTPRQRCSCWSWAPCAGCVRGPTAPAALWRRAGGRGRGPARRARAAPGWCTRASWAAHRRPRGAASAAARCSRRRRRRPPPG